MTFFTPKAFKKNEFSMFTCDECDHVKKALRYLRAHQKYNCDQCELVTKSQSYLKRHKESVHEGIRQPCDPCDLYQ